MIRLPVIMAAAVVVIAATACSAVQTYQTVTDPGVPVQDKACKVLAWGMPIIQQRVNLTGTQLALANGAAQAAAAYCAGKDLSWQTRAIAAADTLSKVLWDVIK